LQAGDIIFIRGHSLFSNAVRFFDPGTFSHVAVAVSATHILEAQFYTRVRIAPMNYDEYEVIDLGRINGRRTRFSCSLRNSDGWKMV
jgi:hypothetical protein